MKPPLEAIRFKAIREELGYTQLDFAQALGLSGAVADLERGRTKIPGYIVARMMELYHINPLWLFGKSQSKYIHLTDQNVAPKIVSIDPEDQENILLINQKASAGYADNMQDPEFVQSLPAFSLPIPEYHHTTFRCFQIEGDSMEPAVQSGDWVIAQALENLQDVKEDKAYIIVDDQSVRFKKVKLDKQAGLLYLISINPEYATDTLSFDQVKEIWQFHSKLSFNLESDPLADSLERIYEELREVKNRLK